MLQKCLVVAGVNDHSSLFVAFNNYKDQESRLKEVVDADEELKQQELARGEGEEGEKNIAVE